MSYIRPREISTTVSSTAQVDGITSLVSSGQFRFDPGEYGINQTFYIEVGISTSDAAFTTTVYMYNCTDSEAVTGTSLTTTNTSPTLYRSGAITVGAAAGNIKNSAKVYEIRLSTDAAAADKFGYLHCSSIIAIPS